MGRHHAHLNARRWAAARRTVFERDGWRQEVHQDRHPRHLDGQSRVDATAALQRFAAKYEKKYPAAVACLTKDQDDLLAFYDLPAEHWVHLRTTNPIESVFATVRHRTIRAKGVPLACNRRGYGLYADNRRGSKLAGAEG